MQGLGAYQAAASATPAMGEGQGLVRKQVESAMNQIRSANQILDGLASQFPAAADAVDIAKKALVKVTVTIVGSQSQSEAPQASTGVMG